MKTLTGRNWIGMVGLAILLMLATDHAIFAQLACQPFSAPVVTTGAIAAGDTAQTLRLFRDGRNTTCTFNRTQTTSPGSYLSDQYTFINTTGATACVFIDLNSTGCGVATNQISVAAYLTSYIPASILTNVIADPGLSTGQNFATSMSFTVAAGATYVIVVHNINAGTFCPSYSFTHRVFVGCRQPGYDLDNDGSSDLAVFRATGGLSEFYSVPLGGSSPVRTQHGSSGDIPVTGQFIGAGNTFPAVFRPSNGTWYTSSNPASNYGAIQWGLGTDVPVSGDYDRDGITDVAVFRPSDNNWYILRSSNGTLLQLALGAAGDKAVPADYDGDGRTDPAVWRPSNGLWTVLSSQGGYGSLVNQQLFGLSTDLPVPADYDGDSKADQSVFRPSTGTWYIFRTSLTTGQILAVPFGTSGDVPQPADYDGDKKADQGVFRPSDNTWYLHRSTAGDTAVTFGLAGDQPVSRPNVAP